MFFRNDRKINLILEEIAELKLRLEEHDNYNREGAKAAFEKSKERLFSLVGCLLASVGLIVLLSYKVQNKDGQYSHTYDATNLLDGLVTLATVGSGGYAALQIKKATQRKDLD